VKQAIFDNVNDDQMCSWNQPVLTNYKSVKPTSFLK